MRPLARAIERTMRVLGIDRDVARADAVLAWPEASARIFGADAATTKAVRADGDTLVVVVPTTQWAGEIRLRERDLVRALTDQAPESRIAHVRCVPSP